MCMPSDKMREIAKRIQKFQIKEGEQPVLVGESDKYFFYLPY